MIRTFLAVPLLVLTTCVVHGVQQSLPTFTVTAGLSDTAIRPGAPLYVQLGIARGRDTLAEPATVSITSLYDNVHVHLHDRDGNTMPLRPAEPWSTGALGFAVSEPLLPGDVLSKTLIVHEWSTTALAPGDYTVAVTVGGAHFRLDSDGETRHPLSDEAIRIDLPLRVLSPDDRHVATVYANLVAVTMDDAVSLTERMRAFDSLLLAQGPLALSAQLDLVEHLADDKVLVQGDQRDLITMFWCIAHTGDAATARALTAFAGRPILREFAEGTRPDPTGIWTVVSWAIHELHTLGSAETRAVTGPFVADHAAPAPFIDALFMHGAGIRAPRVY